MVLTIGHSTRGIEDFLAVLQAHGAQAIVDVRRYPASRRYPHFNREPLAEGLRRQGIAYHAFTQLGGRRKPRPDSPNTAWRNLSFRGYADYMATPAFRLAIEEVEAIAAKSNAVLLCAEAVWWRCHRALIADYLAARGAPVVHIIDARRAEPHRYSEPARIIDGALSYADDKLI